jgi:hypothetical protein
MFTTTRACLGGVCAFAVIASAAPAAFDESTRISEIRIDQPGSDLDEFFELAGSADAPLDGLAYIVIGERPRRRSVRGRRT